MMKSVRSAEAYIQNHPQWSEALVLLRELLLSLPLEETVKWGSPVYTVDGKNVVGLGAFQSWVALWFFQGALLEDPETKLINAQENVTRAMRQWRFGSVEEIRREAELIRSYVLEAIENQKRGRTIKPDRTKPVEIPPELRECFAIDPDLQSRFDVLSKTKRREFAEYISSAKRAETRQKRLEKILPMIRAGVGLNDRYR